MLHQRLLTEVNAHVIDVRVYTWIEAWLSAIEQRIQINVKKSNCGTVNRAVLKVSIIGLLLFIIYIKELDSGMSSNIRKFADDTKIRRQIRLE